jgi:putative transposase
MLSGSCLQRFLPPRSPEARLRRHSLRTVFDAIFYLVRTACRWRYLPSNFPPWQTIYYHLRQICRTGLWTHLWRELRDAERTRVGKDPHPSAAIMDSQSMKTVEESVPISGFEPTSVSTDASAICWWIRWDCRSWSM